MRTYRKSSALFERAKNSIAGGVSSAFRAADQPHPLFFDHAKGSRIWDVDGNEYLDFTLSQGPMILGHCPPTVLDSVQKADSRGQIYAGQHLEEVELAEALQRIIPCAELGRFCVTGSEAAQAALRMARVYTGRRKFIKFEGHYHGWLDSVAFSVSPPQEWPLPGVGIDPKPWTGGIPSDLKDDIILLPWNDMASVQKAFEQEGPEIAAVITEPVMCNNGCILPEANLLQGLREVCDRYGSVLIFDEIITGFRIALGGAQAHFQVTPDVAIFGKAMGSGFPISALVGSRKLMDVIASGKAIQAGTMNAQNACVAAALATVRELESHAQQIYPRFTQQAEHLRRGLEQSARKHGHCVLTQGHSGVFHLGFTSLCKVKNYRDTLRYDKGKYREFAQGMRERGIRLILRGLWYISAAHTQADIEQCLEAARETFAEIKPA